MSLPSQGVTIVTLADDRYAVPLAVLGRSIAENLQPGRQARLYIIDGGIRADTKRRLAASWNPDRLSVEFIPPHFGHLHELPVWGRLPALTYARVFLPALLPEDCGKVILLDSDVMVLTDIERLWNLDLGNHSLLAAQDPAIPYVSSRGGLERYRDLGIPHGHPYFNAGVMLVNVDAWRRRQVPKWVMEFIQQHAGELNYCDQDGLNAVLWNDWSPLDARWQVQPRLLARGGASLPHLDASSRAALAADPWILHFSGRLKPWLYPGSSPTDRTFYHYLDQTSWSGWRPPFSLQAVLYRVYDSPLRDWCRPLEQRGHSLLRNLSRRWARV
jgi:lipopolysaccharide biosynthesis glycosyltransferase